MHKTNILKSRLLLMGINIYDIERTTSLFSSVEDAWDKLMNAYNPIWIDLSKLNFETSSFK